MWNSMRDTAAQVMHRDKDLGTIEPGKSAEPSPVIWDPLYAPASAQPSQPDDLVSAPSLAATLTGNTHVVRTCALAGAAAHRASATLKREILDFIGCAGQSQASCRVRTPRNVENR